MRPGPAKDYLSMYEVDANGCWLFTGAVAANGYGMCRGMGAHRYYYEYLVGPIPEGLYIDHLCHEPAECRGGPTCRHRRCVNPTHLAPTTPRENVLRSNSFVARNAAATHCPYGHPYSGENLVILAKQRTCRECMQRRWREEHARERLRRRSFEDLGERDRTVLRLIKEKPVTDAEVAAVLGLSIDAVISSRVRLLRSGFVADSGERRGIPRRRPGTVWRAA